MRPHRRQPTRFPHPWDSPGKNTGVGCHFLLQCMKVKSEREVTQSCPTLRNPMDCSPPGSSVHGIFQARVLEWGAMFQWLGATKHSSRKRIAPLNRELLHLKCQKCLFHEILETILKDISLPDWREVGMRDGISEIDDSESMRCILLFSCQVVSSSLRPRGLQHTRLPYSYLPQFAKVHVH